MIFQRFWQALGARINRIANFFWQADPMAQLQYEYDDMVDQLKEGRHGLEQYRSLVDQVAQQVKRQQEHVKALESKIKSYLAAGDRETAGHFAIEMQSAKVEMAENAAQLAVHDEAYGNTLLKIKHLSRKLGQLRDKIQKYDADLRLSRAEAELAKVLLSIHVDATGDFGQIEQAIGDEIDRNRAKAKVTADLSSEGVAEIRHEEAAEKIVAEQALREFETGLGSASAVDKRRPVAVEQSRGA
ncbi:MAG: PspA/IM30 family protein [Planctomycetia bacterium]|nr:PspA/IM30 family protein [Planctomycetia bacterium]